MAGLTLDAIRDCLEGAIPAILATVDAQGVPNVSMLSQVHYVGPDRVALSHQFFNKTRANILATRSASVELVDPGSLAQYRLSLDYETTETRGPLFETMKAKLAGIASHTGMEGVFRLLGSDIFRVRAIEPLRAPRLMPPPPRTNLLAACRRLCADTASACTLGDLFDRTLEALATQFGITHAMILLADGDAGPLFTVATLGYAASGVGAEVPLGQGVIGVAARERVPVRIDHMSGDYAYGATIRQASGGPAAREIPFPGLPAPESQIALPICLRGRLLGVLFAESPQPLRFRFDDEDALALVAAGLGAQVAALRAEDEDDTAPRPAPAAPGGPVVTVRHYAADDSVFLDHDYLIKGVAGAILWKLLREQAATGRTAFSNRELRLDPSLRLPDQAENLEARLVLLERRLRDKAAPVQIEKTGRGQFRLVLSARLALDSL